MPMIGASPQLNNDIQFGSKKRKAIQRDPSEEILDCIVVEPYQPEEKDPTPYLRATIPPVDTFERTAKRAKRGAERGDQAKQLSSKELENEMSQHSPFTTFCFLRELYEDNILGSQAIRDLVSKIKQPAFEISDDSLPLLQSYCLMKKDGTISEQTKADVRRIVTINRRSKAITLIQPKRNPK